MLASYSMGQHNLQGVDVLYTYLTPASMVIMEKVTVDQDKACMGSTMAETSALHSSLACLTMT